MKIALGFLLAFLIGVGCRAAALPLPAPPVLIGAALVVAMTLGYLALAGFTLFATLIAHDFWNAPAEARVRELTTSLEHVGLIGGFLLLAAVGPGCYGISLRQPVSALSNRTSFR